MDPIANEIARTLHITEQEHTVRIPIAIESGSRAWGFASPDSDYDCRFIYVHTRDWYLSVFPGKDTIDNRPDAIYDIGGWDVRKVIAHLVKSNAVMLEWLSSGVVYRKDEEVRRELRSLGEAFFNPVSVSWHYLSMARNKLAEIRSQRAAKIKTYFYVLRPLACIRFVQYHNRIPHMEYRRNLAEIPLELVVRERIDRLLDEKSRAVEGQVVAPDPVLLDYISSECAWAEAWLQTQRHEKYRDYARADAAFRSIIGMVNGDG